MTDKYFGGGNSEVGSFSSNVSQSVAMAIFMAERSSSSNVALLSEV